MLDEAELNALYRYSLSLSNNEVIAYDLVHDALEYYLKRADSVHNPLAYIRRTIRCRYIDQFRKSKRFHEEAWCDNAIDHSAIAMNMQGLEKICIERDLLDKIWQKITIEERELLHLWAIEEYTAQEIAEHMQLSRGTVLSKIHRLRKKLCAYMDKLRVVPIERSS